MYDIIMIKKSIILTLLLSITISGCSDKVVSEDNTDNNIVNNSSVSESLLDDNSILDNSKGLLTPEQQLAQNEILKSSEKEIGSTENPLTPNGYADLTLDPMIYMGDISLSLGDTVLLTINVKEPGILEIIGVNSIEITTTGLASLAMPMLKPGTFEVIYKNSKNEVIPVGKIIVK
jgi:hypothetical protein